MFLKIFIFLIVLSLIARFVLRFVMPILQVTKAARQQMNDMQQQMNSRNGQAEQPQKQSKRVDGEFIDYEEVK
ncbi:hypothetical protein DBR32_04775 [Taibaiella sp. KBW10]|uniref:hypothetical protein n=1 Tax=Taibaiella sp. KBW10 TaxID=2153357 RepID=UPI000F5A86A4|nr:hypothetical protein [Taibaiella sp. KBW10]RQO31285.1 hypothetical protein DBR32_04775 [Taibaiella sp. KBW10]